MDESVAVPVGTHAHAWRAVRVVGVFGDPPQGIRLDVTEGPADQKEIAPGPRKIGSRIKADRIGGLGHR